MGTNHLKSAALAVAVALLAPACVLEQATELLTPSAPNSSNNSSLPNSNAAPLAGLWASPSDMGSPESWDCTSVQWNITEQTETTLNGSFAALCNEVVIVSGTATGQLNGDDVTLQVEGTASLQGEVISCPFALTGLGHIENNDTMQVSYEGTTCFGPASGEETLRRPAPNTPTPPEEDDPPPPPPPPPAPPPPPPAAANPPSNRNHVGRGPLDYDRAKKVVLATGAEFPHLLRSFPTAQAAQTAAQELLRRTIWHLELIGFNAARQRNPSGAISKDKLTIFIGGKWHAYDFIRAYGEANQASSVMLFEVWPANPREESGIPD